MEMLLEIRVPLLSVNDQTLSIAEIPLKPGDKVNKGDVIAILETSKTTYSVEAEVEGYIQYHCSAGDDLPVNEIIAIIYDEPVAGNNLPDKVAATPVTNEAAPAKTKQKISNTIFSNKALELIAALKLDKKAFDGFDMVSEDDVRLKADPSFTPGKKRLPERKSHPTPGLINDDTKVELEKLKTNKQREIEYLSSVQSAGLVSVIHTVIELEGVSVFLNHHLRYFKDSLLPVIIYETGKLLTAHKAFNAYYNNQAIAYYKEVNVGFAIDIDKGLKVAGIKNTPALTIHAIEDEMLRLSNAYLDDKLAVDDLSDITFTITDLSGENVSFFHPLINMKNSAILGVSSRDEKLNRCTLSLAFDHRVTEGKQAAIFLSTLKERMESYKSGFAVQQAKQKELESVHCFKCMKTLSEDLSNIGFVKCLTSEGREEYICQACFKGF